MDRRLVFPIADTLELVRGLMANVKEPDADVPAMLIIQTGDHVTFIPASHVDDAEKELLFRFILPALICKMKAQTVVHVSMMWIAKHPLPPGGLERDAEGKAINEHGPPSQDPNRQEALMVVEVKSVGVKVFISDVVRSDLPPIFGEFKELPKTEAYLMRHAQRALRDVSAPG